MKLKGKKVIAIGERDGVQGPAIAECVRTAGAETVLVTTQCYV
jgi:betaine reductase